MTLPSRKNRYDYMVDIVRGLREHGGESSLHALYQWLEENGLADPTDLQTIQKDGGTRFKKEVRWARKEMYDAGIISAPRSGIWALTPLGLEAEIAVEDARALVRVRSRLRRGIKAAGFEEAEVLDERAKNNLVPVSPPNSPTTGPAPTDWRGEVIRSASGPAHTYLVRYGDRDVWKIGHARCVETRLRDLNRHVPYEILGERWELHRSQAWPSSLIAYQMEQAFLGGLKSRRSIGERLLCDAYQVEKLWDALTEP